MIQRKPTHLQIFLLLTILIGLSCPDVYADYLNLDLSVPHHDRGYYLPGEEFTIELNLTDQNGREMRVDNRGGDNTLRGVIMWFTGPSNNYHIVEPYGDYRILTHQGGYNRDAGFDPQTGRITMQIPDDLQDFGTYSVLFQCSRNYRGWTTKYAYEHIQIGQIEQTYTRSHDYVTCNRPGCHANRSLHGTRDTTNCAICHTYDFDLPWNEVMHELRHHSEMLNCSGCHRANAAINEYNHVSCFSCHEYQDAPDGHVGRDEGICNECHDADFYRNHEEWMPRQPDEFSLGAPDNEFVTDQENIELAWEQADDPDNEDVIRYHLELADNPDFEDANRLRLDHDPEYTLENLEIGRDYYWRVLAQDLNTTGRWSSESWIFSTRGNEQRIALSEGWNMISLNVTPPEEYWEGDQGPDVVRMMEQLRVDENNHDLILIKNDLGRFYAPEFNFSNIPYWDLTEGYQVKVERDAELVFPGEPIPGDSDVLIREGWNIVAYLPDYQLSCDSPDFYAFSNIEGNFIMAKDVRGRFALPEHNFSNLPPLTPGQGYLVKVHMEDILNYPLPEEEDAIAGVNFHLEKSVQSCDNMSLLIKVAGEENFHSNQIEAIDLNGNYVGGGNIDRDNRCGVVVWEDDDFTAVKEGLVEDEAFELVIDGKRLIPVEFQRGSSLQYERNGLLVCDVELETAIPKEYYLTEAYPNPFNGSTTLRYGLPEAGLVKVNLYDLSGRHLMDLSPGNKSAGNHSIEIGASDLSSGVVLIILETGRYRSIRKLVFLK